MNFCSSMAMRFAPFETEHIASPITMQGAYIRAMSDLRPYRAFRRLRLIELLDAAGGPKELMRLTGCTDTHLTACRKGRRPIGDDMAASLERGMEKDFGWMDTDPSLDQPADKAQASLADPVLSEILAIAMRLDPSRRAIMLRQAEALLPIDAPV